MRSHANLLRIGAWTTALVCLLVAGFFLHGCLVLGPQIINVHPCDPIPENVIKLGPELVVENPDSIQGLNEMSWPELRAKLRLGDVLREFETEISGGHLITRDGCYLGQTLAQMR